MKTSIPLAITCLALSLAACNPKDTDTENDSDNRRVPPAGPEIRSDTNKQVAPQPPNPPNVGTSPSTGTRSDYQPSTGPAGQSETAPPPSKPN